MPIGSLTCKLLIWQGVLWPSHWTNIVKHSTLARREDPMASHPIGRADRRDEELVRLFPHVTLRPKSSADFAARVSAAARSARNPHVRVKIYAFILLFIDGIRSRRKAAEPHR